MTTQTTPPVTRYRFTADQYEEMVRTGILTRNDRVELIDGEVVDMAPTGQGHVSGVLRLSDIFRNAFHDGALVMVQSPVRLDSGAMPEPDITLLRRRPDYYRSARPGPTDIFPRAVKFAGAVPARLLAERLSAPDSGRAFCLLQQTLPP